MARRSALAGPVLSLRPPQAGAATRLALGFAAARGQAGAMHGVAPRRGGIVECDARATLDRAARVATRARHWRGRLRWLGCRSRRRGFAGDHDVRAADRP
ncbi:hypothetical protein AZ78_2963 [Lysobacter capsici AZ78]|uniref:Uncharacterized protein n=1 Tax=Lysobacter capsici AZ78 TaxID=1444315 RepID=A0A108UA80_9GAMM|nr:hypothetical protein AZ78_2963 [Lysobacter capsici AZ78]